MNSFRWARLSTKNVIEALCVVCVSFSMKRPILWAKNSWFLHHDYTACHTVMVLCNFFFCQKLDSYHFATTVCAWFGFVRFLAIQQTRKAPMRSKSLSAPHISNIMISVYSIKATIDLYSFIEPPIGNSWIIEITNLSYLHKLILT